MLFHFTSIELLFFDRYVSPSSSVTFYQELNLSVTDGKSLLLVSVVFNLPVCKISAITPR